MNQKNFIGSCVENPFDSVEQLSNVIDNAKEITLKEFSDNCDIKGIKLFNQSLSKCFKEFPHSFGFYKNGEIFFFENSRIEHFFK